MKLSKITVIDFETSGLDPQKDKVIEMAALRCEEGKIVSQFCTLIRFEGQLSPQITKMTGITNLDLRNGFEENEAFKILAQMIGDNLKAAHNAIFDLSFLHNKEKSVASEINKLGYTAKYGLPDWYPEYAIPEMIQIKYA